ncbi:Type IV pilus biogenesis protein PilO [Chitinispirillum alkaliphilum]|nr:Type IV pilus biogenesis protein PilO [Chitinispirillum alkaliphilum]
MNKSKLNFSNPKVRNPLIALVVALVMGFLWYVQYYNDAQMQLQSQRRVKEQKEAELRTIIALRPQLDVLRREKIIAEQRLDSLRSIFPDHKHVPRLIKDLASVSKASNIVTTKFNPLPEIQREYYVENRYNVAVSGMYHSLGDFYAYLANFPLIINLSSVIISANPGYREAAANENQHGAFANSIVATFEMTTFSSKR